MIFGNKEHTDFHKVIMYATDVKGKQHPWVCIQYYFDREEHEISGDCTSRRRSTPSLVQKIKDSSSEGLRGKEIYHQVLQDAGGFEKMRSPAEIPSTYRQVHDIARKQKQRMEKDELIEILDMCHSQKDQENAFIRDVRTAPEKTVFLAYNF